LAFSTASTLKNRMALMRCSSAGVFGTGHSYVFPCARTGDAWVRIIRIILLSLDLNRSAVTIGRAGNDYEVAPWYFFFGSHQLADRSDCIDDGRTRRVCHESLQGFSESNPRGFPDRVRF
jgi:hypothetical protein